MHFLQNQFEFFFVGLLEVSLKYMLLMSIQLEQIQNVKMYKYFFFEATKNRNSETFVELNDFK